MPTGHYNEVRGPRKRAVRERWVMSVGAIVIAAVVAVTLFSLTTHQARSGHGCLDFNYTIAMGGEEANTCGASARKLCASPPNEGGLGHDFAVKLRAACVGAKFPYKTVS